MTDVRRVAPGDELWARYHDTVLRVVSNRQKAQWLVRRAEHYVRACGNTDPATEIITVDLQDTCYIDSSALGMMLLLKKHARDNQRQVRMINVSQTILRAFEIVQLDTQFDSSATPQTRRHAN